MPIRNVPLVAMGWLLLTTTAFAHQDSPQRTMARARMQTVLQELRAPKPDPAKAEADLLAITALDPTYGSPWYNLALVQEDLQKLPAAIQSLQQYLQRDPDGASAVEARLRLALLKSGAVPTAEERCLSRAITLRQAGDLAHAIAVCESGIAATPDSWRLQALYGDLLAAGEEFDRAQEAFQRALRTAPAPSQPRLEQQTKRAAFCAYARQQEMEAVQALREKRPDALQKLYHAWQLHPTHPTLALLTATAAIRQGDGTIAVEVTTQLARTGPPGLRAEAIQMRDAMKEQARLAEQIKTGPPASGTIDGLPEFEELKEEGEEEDGAEPLARELPKRESQQALAEARSAIELSQQRAQKAQEREASWFQVGKEIIERGGDPDFARTQISAYRSLILAEQRRQAYYRLAAAYYSP